MTATWRCKAERGRMEITITRLQNGLYQLSFDGKKVAIGTLEAMVRTAEIWKEENYNGLVK